MTKYLSCADTAKLVRQALKEAFPTIKFGVTSKTYAGGASISIRYTDGPTADDVKAIVAAFEGSYFDGMQDYKGQNYAAIDGEEVRFGADFIFVNRKYSLGFLKAVTQAVCGEFGITEPIKIVDNDYGAYIENPNNIQIGGYYLEQYVNREAAKAALVEPDLENCKLLKRVTSLGDDGYGYGCTGRLAA